MTRILSGVIAIVLIIGAGFDSYSAPSAQDLALQAGAGLAGYLIGTNLPRIFPSAELSLDGYASGCRLFAYSRTGVSNANSSNAQFEACILRNSHLNVAGQYSMAATLSVLGLLGGVTVVARAQENEGNTVAAGFLLIPAYVITSNTFWNLSRELGNQEQQALLLSSANGSSPELVKLIETQQRQAKETEMKRAAIEAATPLILIALALIGYHLF